MSLPGAPGAGGPGPSGAPGTPKPVVMDDVPLSRPRIDETGALVVPADCDPRYRWWTKDGMKLARILVELHASRSVWERYMAEPYPEELQRENYPLLGG